MEGKMPAGNTVRPQKWSDVIDLYDDGENSAIWGVFYDSTTRCLGVRWNGDSDNVGYPNQGSNPLWYREPDWLAKMILLDLYSRVSKKPSKGNLEHILIALKECP
jgi:hypothetical protein